MTYPHLLMSRLKNFCTVQFSDFDPNAKECNSQQYVNVVALNQELERLEVLYQGTNAKKPNDLVIEAIVNILRSNDV